MMRQLTPMTLAHRPTTALLAATLLALGTSCAGPSAPGALSPDGRVSVTGRVRVQAAPALRGYGLLQVLAPQASDVKALDVFVTRLGSGLPELQMGELPGTQFPIELRNLRANTSYRVRLEARGSEDERLDDAATDPNDPNLSLCTSEFTTTNVLEQNDLDFRLKLKDVAFSGQANGNVQVSPGVLLDPTEDEVATTSTVGMQDLSAAVASNLAFLRHEGLDHPVSIGQDGFVYIELDPLNLGGAAPLTTSDFSNCLTDPFSGRAVTVDEPNQRLVVDPYYFESLARLGFVGALRDGAVVSLPVYDIQDLRQGCLPLGE